MSEIPFVNRLGDAIDAAVGAPQAARQRAGRRRRRRLGGLALAVLALGLSGATLARLASDPEQLAIAPVACYEAGDLSVGANLYDADGRSPVETCAQVWTARGQTAPPLVACDRDGAVVVLPGTGRGACRRAGVAALPLGYDPARAKLTRLVRDIAAVEAAADCVAPDEMVERVQAVLERTGWAGWRAVLRPGGGGPCGRVRRRGGLPDLLLSPFMDTAARELSVAAGPPRSLDRRLYGRESLVVDLFEASGRRCFTLPDLREHVRSVLAVTGRKVTFKQGRLPANSGMEPPRGDRYAEGCAIVVGAAPLYPSPGEIILEVEIWQRAGPPGS